MARGNGRTINVKIPTAKVIKALDRAWTSTLNVDFDLIIKESEFPKEPERTYEVMAAHTYKDTVDEIENALRILKLTNDETVSTSTYNSIAQYL